MSNIWIFTSFSVTTGFSHCYAPFCFSIFLLVYSNSWSYWKHVQKSIEHRSRFYWGHSRPCFCNLPIRSLLYWWLVLCTHCSSATGKFLYSTSFGVINGKSVRATSFYNSFTHCTGVQRKVHAQKMRTGVGDDVEKEVGRQNPQQMLGDSSVSLLDVASPLLAVLTDEDILVICDRMNPWSDSMDNSLVYRNQQKLFAKSFTALIDSVAQYACTFQKKKNNGLDVWRYAICSKKIHIGRGTRST